MCDKASLELAVWALDIVDVYRTEAIPCQEVLPSPSLIAVIKSRWFGPMMSSPVEDLAARSVTPSGGVWQRQ